MTGQLTAFAEGRGRDRGDREKEIIDICPVPPLAPGPVLGTDCRLKMKAKIKK